LTVTIALHWPALTILVLRTAIATLRLSITASDYSWLTLQDPHAPRAFLPHENPGILSSHFTHERLCCNVVLLLYIALSLVSCNYAAVCWIRVRKFGTHSDSDRAAQHEQIAGRLIINICIVIILHIQAD
jgi:hypothetical protein